MFCKGCGSQLNDGAQFCPKCGYKNISGEETKKKKHTVPIVIGILALVIAIGAGGFFWFRSQEGRDAVSSSANRGEENDNDSSREDTNGPDQSTFSLASAEELLGYIDQAEEIVSQAYSDVQALAQALADGKSISSAESFRERADVLENALSDLSDLRKQADAVSGIDANFENAKNEYFNMVYDSQKTYSEMQNFFSDYFDVFDAVIEHRPKAENYALSNLSEIANYHDDLYTWYESAKEGYSAIDSCPSYLENEWKKYGEILDLNDSIIQKLSLANICKDYLRLQSALNMSDRYDIVEELQYQELISCYSGEVSFFQHQRTVASQLAEEMHTYAGLGEGERSGYEFEYIRTGKIALGYDAIDTIYPSLYNTYDAFLIIKTGCTSGTRKIIVEAEIPGLTQTYKESFTLDSAYRTIYIKPPALTGDLDLTSAKDAQISVTISEQDGTLIEAKTFPVTIKSKYDVEWYTDEYGAATQDNMLCFLTPESSAISQLKRQAIEEISSMTSRMQGGTKESFVGYQEMYSNHYVNTYIQVAGVMRALYEMGVRYNMDPFSISGSNQHILFPKDVLEQQSGLCIETSLVVASALQSAGMHVFLVLPPDHAQVAVEIWNDGTEGTGQYFLIETTALSSGNNNENIFIEYANALFNYKTLKTGPIIYKNRASWQEYLAVPGTYIIDCDDSSILGLTPFVN